MISCSYCFIDLSCFFIPFDGRHRLPHWFLRFIWLGLASLPLGCLGGLRHCISSGTIRFAVPRRLFHFQTLVVLLCSCGCLFGSLPALRLHCGLHFSFVKSDVRFLLPDCVAVPLPQLFGFFSGTYRCFVLHKFISFDSSLFIVSRILLLSSLLAEFNSHQDRWRLLLSLGSSFFFGCMPNSTSWLFRFLLVACRIRFHFRGAGC
jgi:hypothetical protein